MAVEWNKSHHQRARAALRLSLVISTSICVTSFESASLPNFRSFCAIPSRCLHETRYAFHSTLRAGDTSSENLATKGLKGESPRSAYVHIPFCKQRCHYCDFPIRVVGNDPSRPKASALMEEYMDALAVELLQGGSGEFDGTATPFPGSPLQTVYIGGGTPSLLQPEQIKTMLELLERRFGIADGAEVSMEMDPGTFDAHKAAGFRAAGITRASMGVQSFSDEQLEACGRGHRVEQVLDAARALREGGIEDWSLDLLSGLPGDSTASFSASLQQALQLKPTHVSVYDLIIEEGTAFGWWFGEGQGSEKATRGVQRGTLPSQEESADMYRAAHEQLCAAGYEHYEISNYALMPESMRKATGSELNLLPSPFRSQHNLAYWRREPFLAFGMGATSFIANSRLKRPPSLPAYLEWVRAGGPASHLVGDEEEEAADEVDGSGWEGLVEHLMVSLRLREGADVQELEARYGAPAVEEAIRRVRGFVHEGLVVLDPAQVQRLEEGGGGGDSLEGGKVARIRLSCPEGFMMSNRVLVELFR